MNSRISRPRGVGVIAVVNGVAAVITLLFWLLVAKLLFGGNGLPEGIDKSSAASTLGFLIADVVWAVPLLIISIFGLWKMRFWGWTAAQMANVLWFYTLTALFVRDLYAGKISPGILIFLPFALFSAWAAVYLWRVRGAFWEKGMR